MCRLLALVHDSLRRHLLLGPNVQGYLRLHLPLEVLVEDAELVAVTLGLLVLLTDSALPLDVDIDLTSRSSTMWLRGDAALGSLA